ncbi:hypothetical protein Tco_0134655 [Tanacetum coccineum]
MSKIYFDHHNQASNLNELESLFGHLFDEYSNGENQVVLKSFAVTTADTSDKRQQQPDSTSSTSTLATTVTADGNFDLFANLEGIKLDIPADLKALPSSLTDISSNISKLKEAERLNKQQLITTTTIAETFTIPTFEPIPTTTTAPITTITPSPIITPVTHDPPSRTEREHSKIDKGKRALTTEEQSSKEERESDNDSDADDNVAPDFETSQPKKLKKFGFVTEFGERHQLSAKEIECQKTIEAQTKVEAIEAKRIKCRDYLYKVLGEEVIEGFFRKRKGSNKDGTDETIRDFKFAQLSFHEWREKKVDDFNKMAAYLEIQPSVPLSEQDLLLKLNLLAKKKRINFDEAQDFFRSTKRYKASVQFDEHQLGEVLNELVLEMVYFNDPRMQDFISLNDFDDLNDEMLYLDQETFFRFHHGPGVDDLSRIFSSLLLAKVDKRNLNPNTKMRVVEQLW